MPGQTFSNIARYCDQTVPSMEGRARARPNVTSRMVLVALVAFLQWRAGHVPGQTAVGAVIVYAVLIPSMEGRARARPNLEDPSK